MKSIMTSLLCILLGLSTVRAAEGLTLVEDGQSPFSICYDDSKASVKLAAEELQRCLRIATGCELPLTTGPTEGPAIFLGRTAASNGAGVRAADLGPGEYRLLTAGGNLYIVGQDTPDGRNNDLGGRSEATLHGTYAFLEKYLGVRWLVPGPLGEDIPKQTTLTIPPLDVTYRPQIRYRRLPYVNSRHTEVKRWLRRQRITPSPELWYHGHGFRRAVPITTFDEHPDWFPMLDGKRQRTYQLEITNPEVVAAFADYARRTFEKNPGRYCISLSAEDLAPWSNSPEAKAEYTRPDGSVNYSRMVVNFYNRVAREVAKTHPDRIVAGYAYEDHLAPPQGPQYKLEPNVRIVIANSPSYGWGLFKPEIQQRFDDVFEGWSKLTDKLGYYDLPCHFFPGVVMQPTPLEILEFIADRMVRYDVDGMYIYGEPSWGAGPTNYLVAKIYEDPAVDLAGVMEDYYLRMFGPQAGPLIQQANEILTRQYAKHVPGWHFQRGHLARIYKPVYPEIERLFIQAKELLEPDSVQAKRLGMFERNMIVLNWFLRSEGLLPEQCADSPLIRSDEECLALVRDGFWKDHALKRYRLPNFQDIQPEAVAVGVVESADPPKPAGGFMLRRNQRFLLHAPADARAEVGIGQDKLTLTGYRLTNREGKVLQQGLVKSAAPIAFDAKAGDTYFLDIFTGGWFHAAAKNIAMAIKPQPRLHLMQRLTPMYFFVPEADKPFNLTVKTGGGTRGGETVLAKLYDSTGEQVAVFDTSTSHNGTIKRTLTGPAGLWRLTFEKASIGLIDDVYVVLGETLPQWIMPQQQPQIRVLPSK